MSATLDEVCESTEVVTSMDVVEELFTVDDVEDEVVEDEVVEDEVVVDEVVMDEVVMDEDEAFVQVPSLFPLHW